MTIEDYCISLNPNNFFFGCVGSCGYVPRSVKSVEGQGTKAQRNLNLWHLLDHYSYFSRMSEPGKDVNISALLNSFQMGYDKRVRPNYGGKTNFPILSN